MELYSIATETRSQLITFVNKRVAKLRGSSVPSWQKDISGRGSAADLAPRDIGRCTNEDKVCFGGSSVFIYLRFLLTGLFGG